jgi:L-lactate dehydrogenase (cytochrome)
MIGQDVSMPVALAPVGLTGMQSADGEIKAARAAEKFGVPFTLSTMSICSIEDVAAHTTKPFWFQLYTMKDTGFVSSLIQRAKDANCSALVITLDLQILGTTAQRYQKRPVCAAQAHVEKHDQPVHQMAWGLGMLGTKRRTFGNIVGHASGVKDTSSSLSEWTATSFDHSLDWDKVAKIKEEWGGKVILKGILDADDAKAALSVGADAIVVSNHGGRQLDGAISSIKALPAIMDAVGDQIEVHLDSGIRSGQDVLKAIAMGAKGTYIGRSYIYGLGAMGEQGVTKALEVIYKEMDTSMALCGHRLVTDVDRNTLLVPKDFGYEWS